MESRSNFLKVLESESRIRIFINLYILVLIDNLVVIYCTCIDLMNFFDVVKIKIGLN